MRFGKKGRRGSSTCVHREDLVVTKEGGDILLELAQDIIIESSGGEGESRGLLL